MSKGYSGIRTCVEFLDGKEVTQHVFPGLDFSQLLLHFSSVLGILPGVGGNFQGKHCILSLQLKKENLVDAGKNFGTRTTLKIRGYAVIISWKENSKKKKTK